MPKKTDEATRNLVVERLKAGASYNQITKETGLSKPVVWSIKKEAGLPMKPKPGPSSPGTNHSESASPKPTPPKSSQNNSGGHATIPISNGDGITDFQPEATNMTIRPKKSEPAQGAGAGRTQSPKVREVNYAQCDQCGTTFTYHDESEVPDNCPECGA